MANEKNLKPLNTRTKKEQREISKKGGIASGKSRREKKSMKKQLETIMLLPFTLKDSKGKPLLDKYKQSGIASDEIDNQMAVAIELFLTAMGNSKQKIQAIKEIRNIVQDDVLNEEFNVNINILKNKKE